MRRELRNDEGAAMVLVLIVVLFAALVTTSFLTKSSAQLTSSSRLQTKLRLQYAADAGLEKGVRVLSDELAGAVRTHCLTPFTPSQPVTSSNPTFTWAAGGFPVNVTCTDLQGFAADSTSSGLFGAAIVLTGGNDAFTTQGAVNRPLDVGGTIYLNGTEDSNDLKKIVTQTHGDLAVFGCSGTPNIPDSLITTASPYSKYCTSIPPASVAPVVTLPVQPSAYISPASVPIVGGKTCQVFFPGRYTAAQAPQLNLKDTYSYFASGDYYFDGDFLMTVDKNNIVVAGAPSTGDVAGQDSSGAAIAPCSNDTAAGLLPGGSAAAITGTGAAFYMGGNARLDVSDGTLVMNSKPITAGLDIPLSLYTIRATDAGWSAWTGSGTVVSVSNANANMLFNGQINAYDAGVQVFASNNTYAAVRAGVVAKTLALQASASGTNLDVSGYGTGVTVGARIIKLTVVASGTTSDPGGATGVAIVKFPNDTSVAPSVLSWRFS